MRGLDLMFVYQSIDASFKSGLLTVPKVSYHIYYTYQSIDASFKSGLLTLYVPWYSYNIWNIFSFLIKVFNVKFLSPYKLFFVKFSLILSYFFSYFSYIICFILFKPTSKSIKIQTTHPNTT